MRWPLVGREAELEMIGEALADGTAGGVVIAGSPGVGKTRLAGEAAQLAGARGDTVAWVRATSSAASVPFAVLAPLLPPPDSHAADGVEILARVRHALLERAAGSRLVLCVDDGQLLDHASATFAHQLVAAGDAFAIVTVRRGAAVPDALRALWKDDLCALLELEPLTREATDALLHAGLGGPVDGRTLNRMWEVSRGNALFLRELARHGIDRGLLAEDGGLWRWRGRVQAGTRLAELVDLRIDGVGTHARGLLEAVAIAGPLEAGLLVGETPAALELLERSELVERRTDGRRRFTQVAHPLHAEALRARLTPTRLDALHSELADAVQARGARRSGDLMRVATWRLEAGETDDTALFTRAALEALGVPDPALAERLARVAAGGRPDFAAELALGRAFAASGRGAEAEGILVGLTGRADGDRDRTAVALARARNLFWALDRAEDAIAVLERAEAEVAEDACRHQLGTQRARLTAARGRPGPALAAARLLLDDEDVDERARTTAAMGAVESLLSSGQADEAIALAEAWLPAAHRLRREVPAAEPVLSGMRAVALRLSGRLVEATAVSERNYVRLVPQRAGPAAAVEANLLGLIWLARGRVRTALRFCRESVALLRDGDGVGMLAFALAGIAQAAAQAGEPQTARAAVAEMRRTPLGHKAFAVELELARAWSAAAGGELSRAGAIARDAAALARAHGQDAYLARALHDCCRLGDPAPVAAELAEIATRIDGPFAADAAAHAAALVAGDGAALLAVAERFAASGAMLVAVETASAAAAAFRASGRQASARAAAARAGVWLAGCEGARPPTLLAAPDATDLTPREREVALLAAAGSSSREIADRLVVSVRTVDNHLANVYRKLGVTSRQDLPRVLSGSGGW